MTEKELLHKLNFATKILNIKGHLFSTEKMIDQENNILKLVLNECLVLLNEKLGYYGLYDDKTKTICITLASKDYEPLIGHKHLAETGITGQAIQTRKTRRMNNLLDAPEYFKFENTDVDKNVNSAVAIPVILDDDHVMGVYMFESAHENYFTDIDIKILEALVSQASTAIKNIHLVQEIEVSKTLFDSLKEIDKNLLDPSWELKNILSLILNHSLKLVKGEFGNIALKTNENELHIVACKNPENINKKIEIDNSISGLAFSKEEPIYISNRKNTEEMYKQLFKDYLGDNLCELAIPLRVRNEVIGILNIESSESNKFTLSDIEKVKGFAGQAAIAIHIFQLFEDVQKYQDGLDVLAELEEIILSTNQGLQETLDEILMKGLSLINKEHGEILLLNKEKSVFIIKKSTSKLEENLPYPLYSICGLAIDKRKTVYLRSIDRILDKPIDLIREDIYIPNEKERELYYPPAWGSKMQSELVVPLILKGEAIGVLNIESPQPSAFPKRERKLLLNLAHAAAIAIHNAQQFEDINAKSIALKNSINKRNIEMTINLGNLINHRIGNEVGYIKTTLENEFIAGDYGKFDELVDEEIQNMLNCAKIALKASEQVSQTVKELLLSGLTNIDFTEAKSRIETNENLNLQSNIKIEISGFKDMKPSLGNLGLLMEIFFEFISNAKKSMPNGGKILITGETKENQNILVFKDQGCGISKENIDQIWKKEWSQWEYNNKGGGIGLYEVKMLITAWGGKVDVKSEINKGTMFTVQFPISEN